MDIKPLLVRESEMNQQLELANITIKMQEDENSQLKKQLAKKNLDYDNLNKKFTSFLSHNFIGVSDEEEMEVDGDREYVIRSVFQCSQCPETFLHRRDYLAHLKAHQQGSSKQAAPKSRKPARAPRKAIQPVQLECNFGEGNAKCTFVAKSKSGLSRHQNSRHKMPIECSICTFTTPHEKTLLNHIKKKHINRRLVEEQLADNPVEIETEEVDLHHHRQFELVTSSEARQRVRNY